MNYQRMKVMPDADIKKARKNPSLYKSLCDLTITYCQQLQPAQQQDARSAL